MKRVLITGAGGAGTVEVLKSLRGRYYTIACDASPHAGGYAYADRSYVIPFGAAADFEDAWKRILRAEQPDFVIPTVDEEIPKAHRVAKEPEFQGMRVIAPRAEFCDATLDKWSTYTSLAKARLPTAMTWLASEASACTYPAVIKPRDGRGSRDVAYLESPRDLASYLERASRNADAYVVQERVMGVEYTTSVVVTLDGRTLAVVPKEVVDKRGITQVGVTRRSKEIDALGRGIQDAMRADGPFNVQLIMGEDRVPKVIEINPRYSTTVALTLGAGLDEVDVVLRAACGEELGSLEWRADVMMVRHVTQVFVPESEWAPKKA